MKRVLYFDESVQTVGGSPVIYKYNLTLILHFYYIIEKRSMLWNIYKFNIIKKSYNFCINTFFFIYLLYVNYYIN